MKHLWPFGIIGKPNSASRWWGSGGVFDIFYGLSEKQKRTQIDRNPFQQLVEFLIMVNQKVGDGRKM